MARYSTTLTNPMTGEVAYLTSNDTYLLQTKIDKKKELWTKQGRKLEQADATKKALEEIESYRSILSSTLDVDDRINWQSLVDNKDFDRSEPKLEDFFKVSTAAKVFSFVPIVKTRNEKAESEANEKLQTALKEFQADKENFYKTQKEYNNGLVSRQKSYENLTKEGVEYYFNLVLERSEYPQSLSLNYEIIYEPDSKLLLVEAALPNPTQIPKIIEYKYVQSKDEVVEREMKPREFEGFYNNCLYQISLRTIHEVLESDYAQAVDIIVFNGVTDGIDPKTGQEFHHYILSLQVKKEDFLTINLNNVDPHECFRHLKGVSAGSLVKLAPVKPILKFDTNDNRIIEAANLLEEIDTSRNLATMDWADFEVIVRDLLQKEFGTAGCKVEVTRASRDAGVDAIAFDEDPIRGGKFVIQAKRYNNLVPVSAVRDLYGTVVNEGAVKGILVTTSHYGPDALEFAKSKPLTLINGEQLLYLFSKHGYQVKIELQKKQAAASSVSY